MRTVVVVPAEPTLSARLLTSLGAGLGARGHQTVFVVPQGSVAERDVATRYPTMSVRTVRARSVLAGARALRAIVRAVGANAMLVGTQEDALRASLAIGHRGGVVRRLGVGERYDPSWGMRLAGSRTTFVLLGDTTDEGGHSAVRVRAAVAWPRPSAVDGVEATVRLPVSAPSVLAIVTGPSGVSANHAAGAAALRAASRLLTRHPDLRVLLLGEPSAMQAMRLHAASVGLSDRTSVVPLDTLIERGPFAATAVWVADSGDRGAVSVLSAMMRGIPVIVPQGFDTESLVAHRITGFVVDDGDLAGSVSALAHLFADVDAHRTMGVASAARAARLHGWDTLLDRAAEALERAAGQSTRSRSAA